MDIFYYVYLNNLEKTNKKGTNNDLQNITQNTKDRATQSLLTTGGERRSSERVMSAKSLGTHRPICHKGTASCFILITY
jgi:hypothetical protein